MLISNQLSQLQLHISKPDMQKVLQNLQPGQVLKATVVNQVSEGSVKLKIGTQELLAYTKLRLEAGQKLTMEVQKGGKTPELRLLRERTSAEMQANILRQVLPKQIPQARLFNTLQVIERATPELLQKLLPELARKQAQNTEQKSPTPLPQKTGMEPMQKTGSAPLQQSVPALQKALIELLQKIQPESQLQPKLQTAPPQKTPAEIIQKQSPETSQKTGAQQSSTTKTAPPDLQKAIQTILAKALPRTENISGPQIRQALFNSGLFLETNLALGNPAQAAGDLKGNLLNLLLLLRNYFQSDQIQQQAKHSQSQQPQNTAASTARSLLQVLGELIRQTEGSLARIQTHQLNSLPTEESPGQVWQFELPIQQPNRIDSFSIRLEQELEDGKKQAGADWRITLNFNFSPLGPVEAKLSLRGEEISAVFLAEQAASAALLGRNLTKLDDAFTRVGLKVGHLHSQQGKIEPPPSTPPSSTFLLDEKV